MPRSSEEMAKDLDAIDKMAEELDQAERETATAVVPTPAISIRPSPSGTGGVSAGTSSADPPKSEEKTPEGPRQPILPATGSLLEGLSRALGLLIDGAQAGIVGAGIHENAEQLGPLSLVLGTLKRAKEQADQLLGKKNE